VGHTRSYITEKSDVIMMLKGRKVVEVDAEDFDLEKMEDDKVYQVKGGLKVKSNLDEVLNRMEKDAKVLIVGDTVKVRVPRSIISKVKGKKVEFFSEKPKKPTTKRA